MATIGNVTWLEQTARTVERAARPGLMQMIRAVITRRMLVEMDDRMLADIGISRAEALHESARSPWDIVDARGNYKR